MVGFRIVKYAAEHQPEHIVKYFLFVQTCVYMLCLLVQLGFNGARCE